MKIMVTEGASASSRKSSDLLRSLVKSALGDKCSILNTEIFNSMSPLCISNMRESLDTPYMSYDQTLVLIGKSLGAVRTWWLAYSHWEEIKHFKKIRIILIDPHGWQRGDGRWGSYGRKMLNRKWRNLRVNLDWLEHPDFKLINLHQREEFPRGARIDSYWKDIERRIITKSIQLPTGANHWNCTDINTETGQYVAGVIREVVEGLE